jgi:hypothetical protein
MVLDTGTWPNEWLNEMYVRMLANGSQVTEANTWTDGTVYLVWSPSAAFSGNYTINCTWSGHGFTQSVAAGYINVNNTPPTLTNCTTDPHAVNTGEWVEGLATLVLGTWWSSDIGRLWLETNNITVADADTILAGENDIVWVTNNPGNYSMRCGLSGAYVNYTDYYNDSTVHVIGAGTWNISAWNLSTTAAPITGVCSNDTIPKVMMLFFIAFIIFGVLLLNLLVLRLPILNLLPAAGLIVFGISLFFCAWYLAFICWLLAIGIIVMSWSDT